MATDSDGNVSPLFIQNVEVVMVYQWPGLGSAHQQLSLGVLLDLPPQSRRPGDQNQKDSLKAWIFGAHLLGPCMLGFVSDLAVLERNLMFLAKGTNPDDQNPQPFAVTAPDLTRCRH
jgi:hypothetical protein